MAGAHRQPAPDLMPDLMDDLVANGHDYAFFRAVDLLLKETGQQVEERALHVQYPENIRFRVAPDLGFPAGDVTAVTRTQTGFEMGVRFLGLHGSSSPLPSHFLETALWSAGEEGIQQKFNDFFSNRLIWLFFLIWRKYRYDIRYQAGANDQFSNWLFALIGIGSPDARGKTHIPWAKLLTYLGTIAARARSAQMIAGVIAHAFALPAVHIRELQHRKVDIPPEQRCHMGLMNCALGDDMVIGDWIDDVSGKFTIVLGDLTFGRFQDFLPSGTDFERLRELTEFLLKDQLAYDLELHLTYRDHPQFILGDPDHGRLGWTTFTGKAQQGLQAPIVLQARA